MSEPVEPAETPLFLRVFANRKHTSLTATLVLDTAFTALWFWLMLFQGDWPLESLASEAPEELFLLAGYGIANAVLYPFSREIYCRATAFLPRFTLVWGSGRAWMVFGMLLAIVWVIAFVFTWLLAIPLGLVGLVYLTLQEHSGRGFRIVE